MALNSRGYCKIFSNSADVNPTEVVSRNRGISEPKWAGKEVVMKDRKRQRENRRLKNKEELLDRRSSCGVKDLTAYNAVAAMKFGSKATIALR